MNKTLRRRFPLLSHYFSPHIVQYMYMYISHISPLHKYIGLIYLYLDVFTECFKFSFFYFPPLALSYNLYRKKRVSARERRKGDAFLQIFLHSTLHSSSQFNSQAKKCTNKYFIYIFLHKPNFSFNFFTISTTRTK